MNDKSPNDMLDGDHYRTAELVNQLMNNASMKHTFDLIECLKPNILPDKDDTGKDIFQCNYQGSIIGYGKSPYDAMMDFQKKFYEQKL